MENRSNGIDWKSPAGPAWFRELFDVLLQSGDATAPDIAMAAVQATLELVARIYGVDVAGRWVQSLAEGVGRSSQTELHWPKGPIGHA